MQALAGVNPCMVTAVSSRAQLGGITDAQLAPFLEGPPVDDLIAASATQPRLLVIDHTEVYKDYVQKMTKKSENVGAGRYGYNGRAVLFCGWVATSFSRALGSLVVHHSLVC